ANMKNYPTCREHPSFVSSTNCHPEEGEKPSEGPYVGMNRHCSREDRSRHMHPTHFSSTSPKPPADVRSLSPASYLHFQLPSRHIQNLLMRLPRSPSRIHHHHPLRLPLRDRRKSLPHSSKECP